MVRPMGSHSAIWYKWDGMDRYDYLITVGLCGTSHGIPQCHMVQMGWDGQVGLPGHCRTVWYIPWDPTDI